jgi:hypothetical protein
MYVLVPVNTKPTFNPGEAMSNEPSRDEINATGNSTHIST